MSTARICDGCGKAKAWRNTDPTPWSGWWKLTEDDGIKRGSIFGSPSDEDEPKPPVLHVCSLPCLSELAFKQIEVSPQPASESAEAKGKEDL